MDMPIQAALSVILITLGTYDAIERVVSYFQAQTVKEQLELIIVGTTRAQMQIKEEEVASFARYQNWWDSYSELLALYTRSSKEKRSTNIVSES